MTQPLDDHHWLKRAIELAHQCPPSETAFSVGAIVVAADGTALATGYSRETDPKIHAEESALAKLDLDDPRLSTATMYSSLEPCGDRKSRPQTCAQLIIEAGIPRVVYAWREPNDFIDSPRGHEFLSASGLQVVHVAPLAP